MDNLTQYKRNRFSQGGEDGMLSRLFALMRIERGLFCEFGAWDGQFLSNSAALVEQGWEGIFIEGDEARYADLRKNLSGKPVECVSAFVESTGSNSLDAILQRCTSWARINAQGLDLLSIDIDSDDLAIWRSLTVTKPRVVIIEFNYTIPLDVRYENPPGHTKGNSARSIAEYAGTCGYALVGNSGSNLIFVRADARPPELRAQEWWEIDTSEATRFFFGYDGTLIRHAAGDVSIQELYHVPWQPTLFAQPMPPRLRRFSPSRGMTAIQVTLNVLQLVVTRPISCLRLLAGGRPRLRKLIGAFRR